MKDNDLHGAFQSSKGGEARVGTKEWDCAWGGSEKNNSGLRGIQLKMHHHASWW